MGALLNKTDVTLDANQVFNLGHQEHIASINRGGKLHTHGIARGFLDKKLHTIKTSVVRKNGLEPLHTIVGKHLWRHTDLDDAWFVRTLGELQRRDGAADDLIASIAAL
jgi:hypothetical protein